MSSRFRLTLFRTLSALPAPQFEELRFALNPPPGIVPESIAAQGNRVAALLSWIEGSTGCGPDHLHDVLEAMHPGILATMEAPTSGDVQGEPPWTVPYARNPYFTGRDDIIETLYRQLRNNQTAAISQTQAISGLGGIGKTQTAVEYAYRYRDDYRYVFWIRADSELELTNGYVAIAQLLNLPLKDAENQDETVQYVRLWLSREEDWLLIFDNADRPELVQPFLPREIKGHILVTSRTQDFQDLGIVQFVAMETLSSEEAIRFLLRRTGRVQKTTEGNPELTAATELAEELGYLPLALEQAAAYIVTNRVSFADYLKSYRKQRLKRLEKAQPKLGHYPDTIATTWALNLKEVQKTAPAAATLLNYCAFLHPDAIPFNLFTQGAAELGEPLATALADASDDPLEIYDLLNPLVNYSLIRVESESQSLSLHRLVQEVIRLELSSEGCQSWVEPLFKATKQVIPEKDEDIDYNDWPILIPLVNHVQELVKHSQRSDIASTAVADVLYIMGTYLSARGQYIQAGLLLRRALKLRRNLPDNEHTDIASSLDALGTLEYFRGYYDEAEPLLQQAITMRKRLLGTEHYDVARSLFNLGTLYWTQGRYEETESLYQEVLAMRRRLLGGEHPHVADSVAGLAALFAAQGRYEEAEAYYQEALAMWKRLLGDSPHPDVAICLSNLAVLYKNQGNYQEAEALLQQVLSAFTQIFGNNHPNVAQSFNNLATLYVSQERYGEAETLLQKALVIRKQLLGNEHPDVALTLNNLAATYRGQERFDEAEPYMSEALHIWRESLGENHPNVGLATQNLGMFHAFQGRTEEARSLFQQALAILEPKLGAEHPWAVKCRENLAKLDEKEGKEPIEA